MKNIFRKKKKNGPLLHEKKNVLYLRSEKKKKKKKREHKREMIGAVPVSKTTKEIELSQRSTDGITSLSFCPGSDELLAVSSWDSVNYLLLKKKKEKDLFHQYIFHYLFNHSLECIYLITTYLILL